MAITAIKRLETRSSSAVSVLDIETPSAVGHGVVVPPGGVLTQISMFVPWATAADSFVRQHLEIQVNLDVIEPVGVVTATGYPAATITFDGV